MDDFIIKPFDAQALVGSILRHVTPASDRSERKLYVVPETPARSAVPWPEIEGIDSSDVRARLSNDFGLFRSMLKRLLDEFFDVAMPAVAEGPVALAIHKGRMHKLKGSAGMLGAKTIQRLASEAEAASAANEVERASQLATRLSAELQRLHQNAAPVFTATQAEAEEAALPSGGELEPQVVAGLIDLLRQQSLSATDHFSSLSPQLRRLLSKDSYELVRDHIRNLQFSDAANALEASQR